MRIFSDIEFESVKLAILLDEKWRIRSSFEMLPENNYL